MLALPSLAACRHTAPWDQPSEHWIVAETPGVIVHSDEDRHLVGPLVTELARLGPALCAAQFAGAAPPDLEAMVFANQEDYEAVAGPTAAQFFPGVGTTRALLVARSNDDRERLARVVAHELVHRLVRRTHPGLPAWLDEGLATYLSTIEARDDVVVVGRVSSAQSLLLASASAVSVETLAAVGHGEPHGRYGPDFFGGSWALVHYLASEPSKRDRFGELVRRLDDAGADTAVVLRALYPEQTQVQLENAAFAWAIGLGAPGRDPSRAIPVALPVSPVAFLQADPARVRAMSEALLRITHAPPR